MTSWPVSVTTISSSMRAALQPSVEGQKVSRAKTMPGLISVECSNDTRRLMTGFSQIARPMPCPYCSAKAASSLGKPNSCALGHTAAISAVVLPGRTKSMAASMGYRTCYYRCFTIGYASHAMNDALQTVPGISASKGVDGMTTFNPGTWQNHACNDCECCAAERRVAPRVVRITIGTFHFPPDI